MFGDFAGRRGRNRPAFLNAEGMILKIMKMDVEPTKNEALFRYYATDLLAPAMYALEVNKGVFKDIGAEIGDFIVFPENFR